MASHDETCWTLVHGAANGAPDARSLFARTYQPIIRAYLGARWQGGALRDFIDDAVQDTFLECFREGGALGRADPNRPGRFRTFLYAVVRNVARRHEEKRARDRARQPASSFDAADLAAEEERLSRVFDRAWADSLLKRAAARQRAHAQKKGEGALRRVELMRLRFGEDLPIREVARRWGEDPAVLHREYAKARDEFKEALREEVAFHHPGTPGEIERECAALLALF